MSPFLGFILLITRPFYENELLLIIVYYRNSRKSIVGRQLVFHRTIFKTEVFKSSRAVIVDFFAAQTTIKRTGYIECALRQKRARAALPAAPALVNGSKACLCLISSNLPKTKKNTPLPRQSIECSILPKTHQPEQIRG